jgi:hypothetical protein
MIRKGRWGRGRKGKVTMKRGEQGKKEKEYGKDRLI